MAGTRVREAVRTVSAPARQAAAPAPWRNWAGQQRCEPAFLERPGSEAELAALLAGHTAADRTVRAVGSGHSFSPAAVTDGVQVDLTRMARVLSVDAAARRVRVQPGITLHALAAALHEHGLALENQGDIDAQTLGGALATATHGTGARFGNLSSRVIGGRLVTATGEVLPLAADPDQDLLRAARVSLGALGVLSEVELEVVPAFRLHKVESIRPLREVLDGLDELVAAHDHLELYALPWSSKCLVMASRRTQDPPEPAGALRRWVVDDVLANRAFELIQRTGRRFPRATPTIGRLTGALASGSERIDHSHRVFASERRVRFVEMELGLPRATVREALEGVLALVERRRLPVSFPIEVRFTAPDDALLSTAHGRETAYLAVHQYVGAPAAAYFAGVEELGGGLDARPHWGKCHAATHEELAARYPTSWGRFAAVRARLDPGGVFTSPWVERVLGPVGT